MTNPALDAPTDPPPPAPDPPRILGRTERWFIYVLLAVLTVTLGVFTASWLGIDQVIDTPLGKIYNKNGRWQNGSGPNDDAEQSVAYFLQEDMEVVLLVNSWIGAEQASVRGSVKDAYLANIE